LWTREQEFYVTYFMPKKKLVLDATLEISAKFIHVAQSITNHSKYYLKIGYKNVS
jgi:hypothetical protein